MTEKQDENLGSFYVGRMRPPPEPKRVMPRGFLTVVAVLAFAGIIWYAYPQGAEKYTDVNVPVITADAKPYKSKPVDPGGMEVPHQDSTVFETLDKKSAGKKTDKLAAAKKPALEEKKPQLNLEPESKAAPEKKEEEVKPVTSSVASAKAGAHDSVAVDSRLRGNDKTQEKEKPVAAAKETVKPASGGGVYIQLGAYKEVSGAKGDWARLQKQYAQLKGLTMRTEKAALGGKGVLYRLQAGKLTEAKAKDICALLRKDRAACLVVK